MRRTSVQPPKGTWIGALELLKPIATIIKSPAEVPAGTGMVTFDLGGRKATRRRVLITKAQTSLQRDHKASNKPHKFK